jgi:uncharacterized protein
MGTPTLPGLRDPRNPVSRRAIGYWTVRALVRGLVLVAIEVGVALGVGFGLWFAIALPVTVLVVAVYALIMPRWRYRVHRWEATDEAVYSRAGWVDVHWRIAPINRIQTIDSHRSFGERLFGLANVTVTTASAEGHVYIHGLDRATADRLLDELTIATGHTPGDAT